MKIWLTKQREGSVESICTNLRSRWNVWNCVGLPEERRRATSGDGTLEPFPWLKNKLGKNCYDTLKWNSSSSSSSSSSRWRSRVEMYPTEDMSSFASLEENKACIFSLRILSKKLNSYYWSSQVVCLTQLSALLYVFYIIPWSMKPWYHVCMPMLGIQWEFYPLRKEMWEFLYQEPVKAWETL